MDSKCAWTGVLGARAEGDGRGRLLRRIEPADNFAGGEAPSGTDGQTRTRASRLDRPRDTEGVRHYGEIQEEELPPSIAGMFELELEDGDLQSTRLDNQAVGLTYVPARFVAEAYPRPR